eukprot:358151-Chlamydomonas_euryale.AAC.2
MPRRARGSMRQECAPTTATSSAACNLLCRMLPLHYPQRLSMESARVEELEAAAAAYRALSNPMAGPAAGAALAAAERRAAELEQRNRGLAAVVASLSEQVAGMEGVLGAGRDRGLGGGNAFDHGGGGLDGGDGSAFYHGRGGLDGRSGSEFERGGRSGSPGSGRSNAFDGGMSADAPLRAEAAAHLERRVAELELENERLLRLAGTQSPPGGEGSGNVSGQPSGSGDDADSELRPLQLLVAALRGQLKEEQTRRFTAERDFMELMGTIEKVWEGNPGAEAGKARWGDGGGSWTQSIRCEKGTLVLKWARCGGRTAQHMGTFKKVWGRELVTYTRTTHSVTQRTSSTASVLVLAMHRARVRMNMHAYTCKATPHVCAHARAC